MKRTLSKLKKIELREGWEHEAYDFTDWMSMKENLDLLGEEIGAEIKLIKTEASVGKYSVDILAEDERDGKKIIIENQLEETNHDHLGKIITYAAGYDAEIIIWIVKDVRDEHQKAVEWLNEHTDENTNFFLLKIELWQIDDSNPAPNFDIIASPNEWAKTIKNNPLNSALTDTKLQQLEFWTKFKKHVREKDTRMRWRTPQPQHWYDVSIGTSEAHIALTVNTRDNWITCDLYINDNKQFFEFLKDNQEQIEDEIKESGNWWNATKASGVRVKKEVIDVFDEEKAEEYFEWLYENTVLFHKVFGKYLKQYKKVSQ